jgi:glutamyl-tRNA reductase
VRFVGTGISHKTAPIELREKLAKATSPVDEVLAELRRSTQVREVCLVSTCNRVEFYAAGEAEAAALARDLRQFVVAVTGLSPTEVEPHLYEREGLDGVRHLFRVASSLDSMVLGEPQILGQVKQAYQTAHGAGAIGPNLNRIFERAFAVAKRVRTETGIAENAVSMSFAAVELGREIFTTLEGKSVLLIGAGKMSTLAAKHLVANGIGEIRVANRSLDRAQELAAEIGGSASSLSDLELLLQRADIVISSTATPGYVVERKLMAKVVRGRRYRPILFVDIAVPRDIDPAIEELENVFVYDVDDLNSVVEDNRQARAKEAEAAERLVETELDNFVRWARAQQVVPVIKALRGHALGIAEQEVERTLAGLGALEEKDRKRVRAMSQAIVNKMLHPVMTRLKEEGAKGDPGPLADALVRAFDLQLEAEPPDAGAEPSNVVPFSKDGTQR